MPVTIDITAIVVALISAIASGYSVYSLWRKNQADAKLTEAQARKTDAEADTEAGKAEAQADVAQAQANQTILSAAESAVDLTKKTAEDRLAYLECQVKALLDDKEESRKTITFLNQQIGELMRGAMETRKELLKMKEENFVLRNRVNELIGILKRANLDLPEWVKESV